jgi:DNA-binding MarR family transcriptional regulator
MSWRYGGVVVAPRQDLLVSLLPITKALRRIEDEAAAAHGVTMWQYAVLAVVEDRPGLSQRQVATRLDYSVNRLVHDVDRLEALGLLERTEGGDRRAYALHTTAQGRAARRKVQASIHAAEDGLLADVPAEVRRRFTSAAPAVGAAVVGRRAAARSPRNTAAEP